MKHSELGTAEVHRVHDKEFTSLANLFAATTVTADIGKIYKVTQGNTQSLYMVRSAGSPGTFTKVAQGRDTLTTTNDATETTAWSVELVDETAMLVTAKVVAMQEDGGQRNAYHIQGLFYATGGGVATQQGSTAAIMTAIESDAAWDCTFDVNGQEVRLRVTGDAGNDVKWTASIEVVHVM